MFFNRVPNARRAPYAQESEKRASPGRYIKKGNNQKRDCEKRIANDVVRLATIYLQLATSHLSGRIILFHRARKKPPNDPMPRIRHKGNGSNEKKLRHRYRLRACNMD